MSAPNTYVLINVSQEGVLDFFLLFIEKTKRALFIYTIMHTHHTMLYFLCEHAPSSLLPLNATPVSRSRWEAAFNQESCEIQ